MGSLEIARVRLDRVQDLRRRIVVDIDQQKVLSKDAQSVLLAKDVMLLNEMRGEVAVDSLEPKMIETPKQNCLSSPSSDRELADTQAKACKMMTLNNLGSVMSTKKLSFNQSPHSPNMCLAWRCKLLVYFLLLVC